MLCPAVTERLITGFEKRGGQLTRSTSVFIL